MEITQFYVQVPFAFHRRNSKSGAVSPTFRGMDLSLHPMVPDEPYGRPRTGESAATTPKLTLL